MKIAFVSLLAYPLFDPSCKGKFGGAEVQSVLVAQGLAALGHEVTVVTFDHGQPDAQDFNGLKVVKSIPAMSGKQAAKALASQATLLRVLRSINPDVVIQPAQTGLALTVALYALRHRRKSACLITSDSAFTNQGAKFGLDRLGFALGLRLCDAILALNDFQEQSARAIRWRRARVVAQVGTACDMPPGVEAGGREHVLWVGRCIPVKEPTVFAELARRVPEAAFVMVMPPQDDGLFRAVQSAAEGVGNLKIVPGVPRRDVHAYFSKARFLVNTSVCEGFPTTFVEAAAWACPVVSLRLDPNGFLEKAGAGEVCGGDMDRLVETTRRFWNDPELCARVGRTAREYVERDNEPRRVAAQYVEAFQRLPA